MTSGPKLSWRQLAARVSQSRWLSPLLLVLLWEACVRIGWVPRSTLEAPSAVLQTMWRLIASGELPHSLWVSFQRMGAGLLIGSALGIAFGLAAGLSRRSQVLLDPPLQMLRTLPTLALLPLFIVWFGIGETPKIALIAFGTMFPIYLNLYNGILGVDVRLLDMARSFGLNQRQLIVHVVLPGALPSLLVGLRYALSVSVLVLVVAEQINATAGIGYLVNRARDFMRTDVIVVCLIVYAALGLAVDGLVRWIERRALAWRPQWIKTS